MVNRASRSSESCRSACRATGATNGFRTRSLAAEAKISANQSAKTQSESPLLRQSHCRKERAMSNLNATAAVAEYDLLIASLCKQIESGQVPSIKKAIMEIYPLTRIEIL